MYVFRLIISLFCVIVISSGPVQAITLNQSYTENNNLMFEERSGSTSQESSCGSNFSLTGNFSLGQTTEERQANLVMAFMSYGLNAAQASGPVGNFMWESGGVNLPPNVNENPTPSGAKAGPPNDDDRGYGWAQWSFERKTAFVNYMHDNDYVDGTGGATDAANFGYLKKELDSPSYTEVLSELKKQNSPESAATSFMNTFERPNAQYAHESERRKNAQTAYDNYMKMHGGGSVSSSSCGGESVTSQDYGEVVFPLKGSKSIVKNPGIFQNGTTSLSGHNYTAYDIMTPGGTPVVAFMPGKISYLFSDTCNGQSVVVWNEDYKIAISYMHMQPGSVDLRVGNNISVGQEIGKIGRNLPNCNGDHLHIDASTDKIRQPCSRAYCAPDIMDNFRSIGKPLFDTYQKLEG